MARARLTGKKILICRSLEDSLSYQQAFRELGAEIEFVSTFQTELEIPAFWEAASLVFEQIKDFHWVILSSKNGVRALTRFLQKNKLSPRMLSQPRIAVVGAKTAAFFKQVFAGVTVELQAGRLQAVLDEIASQSQQGALRVLHLTSAQSVMNIRLSIPANMELLRLPLYQTVTNRRLSPDVIERIRSSAFDSIVFSSPSSFEGFRDLIGGNWILQRTSLAVFGHTTRRYIESRGYPVAVVPPEPTPAGIAAAVAKHLHNLETNSSTPRNKQKGLTIQ